MNVLAWLVDRWRRLRRTQTTLVSPGSGVAGALPEPDWRPTVDLHALAQALGQPVGMDVGQLGFADAGQDGSYGSALIKANGDLNVGIEDPKALYWDPFSSVQQLGYREKPSAITYGQLNAMAQRVPIAQAIIQTRVNQISAFATPQHYKFETGFRVRMRDATAKPTPADKKFIARMENELMLSGVDNGFVQSRDSFETFLRKITRDSLTYDQICVEIVPDLEGRPARWLAVDAASIRLADRSKLFPQDDDPEAIHTVQLYNNVIVNEFTRQELAFEVRNPRTDILSYGYGTSELEMVVSTITAILWAWQYNQNFFSQGTVAKGLLNLVGPIPEKHLRAFRRNWYQMVSGVANAFRTPITNAEKVEWINMQNSNRDMEFSAWMDFLIKVVSATYAMDPVEINFRYGNSGQKGMFESSNRAKAQESRERGLRPILRHIGRLIDKHIIWPIDPSFCIEFVGLESQTPKELADLMTQRVRTLYTIDELRAENDYPPLPNGMGQVILDANWMNARNSQIQREDAQKQQAQAAAQAKADQAAQTAQAGAVGGVDHLDSLLAELESKAKSAGGKGAERAPVNKDGSGSGAGQTRREIENEIQGVGVEASLKDDDMLKSIEVQL